MGYGCGVRKSSGVLAAAGAPGLGMGSGGSMGALFVVPGADIAVP